MKVAIVHYWLVKMRGGENVLEALCELYPGADIFTHVYCPEMVSDVINSHKVTTTFIQRLPFSKKLYQVYLPLMPFALSQLKLTGYDLVISSESGPAKGVKISHGAKHVCYCHTPMRYIWDMYDEYRSNAGFLTRALMPLLITWLRKWDRATSRGVDQFIANSRFVQQRIKNIYGRESTVIYPPVAVDQFKVSDVVEDYYLYAGELTHYKQPQLAIEAFNRSGRKLLVIGEGGIESELKSQARPNITFLGRQSFDRLRQYFSQCRALIFPGIEDFGIVPVEVMASGRPVIAYRGGGALETVVENESGLFFDEQTPDSLNGVIDQFEASEGIFRPADIRNITLKFSKERFLSEVSELIALMD
jgi:glycosyltransferase involved in cell wall biosynthesis